MKNTENTLKIDEVLEELYYLREENQDLRLKNDFLQRKNAILLRDNARITLERGKLVDEIQRITSMGMFEFGNKYCSDESLEKDGRAFARSLLGKPMTDSDLAEERFLENGVKAYEASLRLGDDY